MAALDVRTKSTANALIIGTGGHHTKDVTDNFLRGLAKKVRIYTAGGLMRKCQTDA
jgi:hypothetical protein